MCVFLKKWINAFSIVKVKGVEKLRKTRASQNKELFHDQYYFRNFRSNFVCRKSKIL